MASGPVYLDYNATTPLAPEVIAEVSRHLGESWQNPSSGYASGRRAKWVVEDARAKVAQLLNAEKDNCITFTSGGTEVHANI